MSYRLSKDEIISPKQYDRIRWRCKDKNLTADYSTSNLQDRFLALNLRGLWYISTVFSNLPFVCPLLSYPKFLLLKGAVQTAKKKQRSQRWREAEKLFLALCKLPSLSSLKQKSSFSSSLLRFTLTQPSELTRDEFQLRIEKKNKNQTFDSLVQVARQQLFPHWRNQLLLLSAVVNHAQHARASRKSSFFSSLLLVPCTPVLWDLFRTTLNSQGSVTPTSHLQLGKVYPSPQRMPLLIQGSLKFQRALLFRPKDSVIHWNANPGPVGLGEWIYRIISTGK